MSITAAQKKYFTTQLLNWHHNDNDRSLPWKSEKDPYKIWLSEIILQQTRALQGLPYYTKFTEAYPTITDMAAAPDEEVFRIWQGLGYYNRCKNMLATARYIAQERAGKFPDTHEDILSLKGIGPYTAAAIASFAYNLPHAVVDGNVYRVLARYFCIDTPFDTTSGKKQFASLAQELIDTEHSSAYNQAIMDLGATICTPRNPKCGECPLHNKCVATRNEELISLLPVRSKKIQVATRYFNYIILLWKDSLWIHKRTGRDIWENLHQPLLLETTEPADEHIIEKYVNSLDIITQLNKPVFLDRGTQRLTHRVIASNFYVLKLDDRPTLPVEGLWIHKQDLDTYAYPKTVLEFFKKHTDTLWQFCRTDVEK